MSENRLLDKPAPTSVAIEQFSDTDARALLSALADASKRVQRVALSNGTIWIKRYGTERASLWLKLHGLLAAAVPVAFLRPSRRLKPGEMVSREVRKIEAFRAKGFLTPLIIHQSTTALILSDAGRTIEALLLDLRGTDSATHDEMLVTCARELGKLHGAGLCHGRPHPRDLVLSGDRITFLDFEEEPDAVMPLFSAQARDIWLLLLQIASRATARMDCLNAAYAAWAVNAPTEAERELRRVARFLSIAVPIARFVNSVRQAKDLQRFIVLMVYLSRLEG